jgi:hypothetical protein
MYNLNYVETTFEGGYEVKEKLYLGVWERKG